MTTINDISDLVRILEERPDWRATVRNLLLGEDLLNVPQQVAQLIETTNQLSETTNQLSETTNQLSETTNQLSETVNQLSETVNQLSETVNQLSERVNHLSERVNQLTETVNQLTETVNQISETLDQFIQTTNEHFRVYDARLNRLEGRQGNLEGNDYEHRIANRAMFRARRHFGLNNPIIAMSNYLRHSPDFDRVLTRAVQSGEISDDDMYDLYEADIIVSDDDNRYVVFEVSLTADSDDIARAARRADVMAAISGAESMAAVATESIHELQQDLAGRMNVAVFVIPYR